MTQDVPPPPPITVNVPPPPPITVHISGYVDTFYLNTTQVAHPNNAVETLKQVIWNMFSIPTGTFYMTVLWPDGVYRFATNDTIIGTLPQVNGEIHMEPQSNNTGP